MKDKLFQELVASLREGAAILKGEKAASRIFTSHDDGTIEKVMSDSDIGVDLTPNPSPNLEKGVER